MAVYKSRVSSEITTSIMNIKPPRNWPKTIEEATIIQEQLCSQVVQTDQLNSVQYVAGVDVGFLENNTVSFYWNP
jgi:deoxyribonuclease V